MPSERKTKPTTIKFRDFSLWSTKLPDVKFAVLPPSNTRPNPLAVEDRLYVSVFSPGAICALERDRGRLIWRKEVSGFGSASVYLHNETLFAQTSNTLLALDADSGETLWSFCPYGTDGETIYSSPSVGENRLYIGDRRGWLHCLDVENGRTIWNRRTNRARNDDVNSTPLLMDGLVIVSTNAKSTVAYDARTGKLSWKQKLDAPSVFGPLIHQDLVLAVADSLYLMNPHTGRIRKHFLLEEKIQLAESTPRTIVATFWPVWGNGPQESPVKDNPMTIQSIGTKSGRRRKARLENGCSSFRYAAATRLLYVSHYHGIDLLHPGKLTPLCTLKTDEHTGNGVAPVDVKDKTIYALNGNGTVYALRHPATKKV